ncbi:(2,3-dihydroxybenzoyl)adenylate synthase [Nonomuraea basaltis]|uniref:(2,3-dihydroxybenzoyl)adenylate synthase n=1 Tax=Nonomuraea basaltis TaxID=2495887 RepID=UPI00110C588A|nr:(2,3-dihydroxybenzoyl)adenylate synthase [Nonomuraea basaltis]TMR94958.1 (2,3-dihydroxybenzoyl)adenylate synthase [Nonomuraea basaltis]
MPQPLADGVVGWPEELAAAYRAKGIWRGRPLASYLPDTEEIALVDGETRLTYAELRSRADGAAGRLAALGLRPGDRVVVQLPNGWPFVVLTLACLRSGIVPVMALPAHRRHELLHLAGHAEAVAIAIPDQHRGFDHLRLAKELVNEVESLEHLLVLGAGGVDLAELCAPAADPAAERSRWDARAPGGSDVAVFLLSGGTTGLPKLITRTHDDYTYNATRSAEVSGIGADSVYLATLPLGHNFPLACPGILGTLLAGGRVVIAPSPDPAKAFPVIAAEGVTHTSVVPAVAARWLDHAAAHPGDRLASLRVLQVGGARLADELAFRVRPVLGCTLQQVFGMAEGLLNYTRLDDPEEIICTTQGRPMCPEDEVLLVDELDRPVPDGEPGSLLTRGPYTPRGYYRAPEQNARAFTPDGWYRSGDICRRDPHGNLIVEGRDKDMINRGGEKISAEEVENLLYRLDAVAQVAVVAMPDLVLGERICAYIVGEQVSLEELRAALTEAGVAAYKLPDRVVHCAELPTTKIGKIDKKALREDIARRMQEPAR